MGRKGRGSKGHRQLGLLRSLVASAQVVRPTPFPSPTLPEVEGRSIPAPKPHQPIRFGRRRGRQKKEQVTGKAKGNARLTGPHRCLPRTGSWRIPTLLCPSWPLLSFDSFGHGAEVRLGLSLKGGVLNARVGGIPVGCLKFAEHKARTSVSRAGGRGRSWLCLPQQRLALALSWDLDCPLPRGAPSSWYSLPPRVAQVLLSARCLACRRFVRSGRRLT